MGRSRLATVALRCAMRGDQQHERMTHQPTHGDGPRCPPGACAQRLAGRLLGARPADRSELVLGQLPRAVRLRARRAAERSRGGQRAHPPRRHRHVPRRLRRSRPHAAAVLVPAALSRQATAAGAGCAGAAACGPAPTAAPRSSPARPATSPTSGRPSCGAMRPTARMRRQVALPGPHEPRDPHAAERPARPDGPGAARGRIAFATAPSRSGAAVGAGAAAGDQRRARGVARRIGPDHAERDAPFDLADALAEAMRGIMPLVRAQGPGAALRLDRRRAPGSAATLRASARSSPTCSATPPSSRRARPHRARRRDGRGRRRALRGHRAGRGHRTGARRRHGGARVRRLRAGRRQPVAAPWRHRARPGDRTRPGARARRRHHAAQHAGPRLHLHVDPAAGQRRRPASAAAAGRAARRSRVDAAREAWLLYRNDAAAAWMQRRLARLGWRIRVLPGIDAAIAHATGTQSLPQMVLVPEHRCWRPTPTCSRCARHCRRRPSRCWSTPTGTTRVSSARRFRSA